MTSNTPLTRADDDASRAASTAAATQGMAAPGARRAHNQPGIIFRRTTMRRAIFEGMLIFLAGRLIAMVPPTFWPAALFPLALVLRLVLMYSPPVWAAMRVTSTRREKMSRRFWRLGPVLALLCTGVDAAVALGLGEARLWGGAAGPADAVRLFQGGPEHLSALAFLGAEVAFLIPLAIYFTIAVVCTRLANGGFLRFTMPAGNGRVTL
jgi:hypothetical protein